MNYTIYNKTTGLISKTCNTTSDISIQLSVDEDYVEGTYDDSSFYIKNKEPIQFPSKPNYPATFSVELQEWVPDTASIAYIIQSKRNELLILSDWTQIPNGPLTQQQQEAWAVYRQQLRDIPEQSGYPFNVVWPTPP
jgi:hypothetical protein